MSLTFYYAPMSTASVTEAVLAELGVPCERIKLDIQAGETKKPEFLKINPNGKVPVIVHDGTVIWESSAITLYLAEVFGVEARLYPALGTKRGEAMKWITWSNVTLAEAGSRLAHAHASSPASDSAAGASQNLIAAEAAKKDLSNCLTLLNAALDGKNFLLGDYSLVDTHVQSFVWWLSLMNVDMKPFPNVSKWRKLCHERPALAKLMSM